VPDLAGLGGGADCFHHLFNLLAGDGDFDANLWQEIHGVFRAAIDFHVPLLPPIAFHLAYGHAVNADGGEGVAHLVEFERLDDRDDELHLPSSSAVNEISDPNRQGTGNE